MGGGYNYSRVFPFESGIDKKDFGGFNMKIKKKEMELDVVVR